MKKYKTRWRKVAGSVWQYIIPIAVIGTVSSINDSTLYYWSARVMMDCRIEPAGPAIQGKATSFEGAKRIVELLCEETGTLDH